ncbi:hypothetical protein [Mycobacterium lepromatosis]|uniref:hypothetical protein n=1 Tax=Mycobacterium lepromatosis TaxID=480418 RepID=UPI0009E38638|nr:hypothetical protein [Mycobacterium lepromatosis]
MELLTDAGVDNVVPVCFLESVETLARAVAPVIGYAQTAVCLLEHDWETVVMVLTPLLARAERQSSRCVAVSTG